MHMTPFLNKYTTECLLEQAGLRSRQGRVVQYSPQTVGGITAIHFLFMDKQVHHAVQSSCVCVCVCVYIHSIKQVSRHYSPRKTNSRAGNHGNKVRQFPWVPQHATTSPPLVSGTRLVMPSDNHLPLAGDSGRLGRGAYEWDRMRKAMKGLISMRERVNIQQVVLLV